MTHPHTKKGGGREELVERGDQVQNYLIKIGGFSGFKLTLTLKSQVNIQIFAESL